VIHHLATAVIAVVSKPMIASAYRYFRTLLFGEKQMAVAAVAGIDPVKLKAIVDEVLTKAAELLPVGRGHYAATTLQVVFDYEWEKLYPTVAPALAAKGITV
jgi:hypothetical protein